MDAEWLVNYILLFTILFSQPVLRLAKLFSRVADSPWPWVVRIGTKSVGVLLTQQHVVTLSHCIEDYSSWFGGYYHFYVEVGGFLVDVSRVEVQSVTGSSYSLALLTLGEELTWIPVPVCVGTMQDGLLAAAVGWGGTNTLREEPIRLHLRGQCRGLFEENYEPHMMICGGPGPGDCGAPLLQSDDGRWMLVGLGVGDDTPVSRYVRLEPSRKWLENE